MWFITTLFLKDDSGDKKPMGFCDVLKGYTLLGTNISPTPPGMFESFFDFPNFPFGGIWTWWTNRSLEGRLGSFPWASLTWWTSIKYLSTCDPFVSCHLRGHPRGVNLKTLKISVWEDWGTLGNSRQDERNHHLNFPMSAWKRWRFFVTRIYHEKSTTTKNRRDGVRPSWWA